jgi:hypothetical protein
MQQANTSGINAIRTSPAGTGAISIPRQVRQYIIVGQLDQPSKHST